MASTTPNDLLRAPLVIETTRKATSSMQGNLPMDRVRRHLLEQAKGIADAWFGDVECVETRSEVHDETTDVLRWIARFEAVPRPESIAALNVR
jgi:hypothetical protein